jgi:hypothetical protein
MKGRLQETQELRQQEGRQEVRREDRRGGGGRTKLHKSELESLMVACKWQQKGLSWYY